MSDIYIGNKKILKAYVGNNLVFKNRLYLIKNGEINIKNTGGFSNTDWKIYVEGYLRDSSNINVVQQNGYISIKNSVNGYLKFGIFGNNNPIDVKNYKKLHIIYRCEDSSGVRYRSRFSFVYRTTQKIVCESQGAYDNYFTLLQNYTQYPEDHVVDLESLNITIPIYFGFYLHHQNTTCTIFIYDMYLE